MCGGGGGDGGAAAAMQETIRAREARAHEERLRRQEEKEQKREQQKFEQRLEEMTGVAMGDIESYFSNRGLETDPYRSDMQRAVNRARSSVPEGATEIGSYFDSLGETVFSDLSNSERAKLDRSFDDFAYEGFAKDLISDTADDDFVSSIYDENRQDAEEQLTRLLDRGVLTDSGYAAALSDLDKQGHRARSALEEVALAQLEGGRSDLRNIVSGGRSRLSDYELGDSFDPFSYETQVNDKAADFFAGLGESIRGSLTEDLFDLDSAFGKGGFAQGAQNTKYDPNASAGAFFAATNEDEEQDDEDEDEDDFFAANTF